MKTTSMIALIAVISAASIGAISINGFSAIPFATASVSPENGVMMGHVEYILRDADGNIKSYSQADNLVVNKGDDCVLAYTFNPSNTAGSDNCTQNANGFRFIGIGNVTAATPADGDTTLTDTTQTFASFGVGGLMAMKTDSTVVFTPSSGGGTAKIETETPFTFTTGRNATTIVSAGLFDSTCTTSGGAIGACTGAYPTSMFSLQTISVVVAGGDSLNVAWTITVGQVS